MTEARSRRPKPNNEVVGALAGAWPLAAFRPLGAPRGFPTPSCAAAAPCPASVSCALSQLTSCRSLPSGSNWSRPGPFKSTKAVVAPLASTAAVVHVGEPRANAGSAQLEGGWNASATALQSC